MGNPAFKTSDRVTTYIWVELSHIPSDRPNTSQIIREDNIALEFVRTNLIFGRTVIGQVGVWEFVWKNIPLSMVKSLQNFFDDDYFYYYPDVDVNSYFIVYISDTQFLPQLQDNGNYDLEVTCREYGCLGTQSSSSVSSSSSSSSQSKSVDLISASAAVIYLHSGQTATIITSFAAVGTDNRGICVVAGDLYSSDVGNDKIYQHSGFTSQIIGSFGSPNTSPSGLGYDSTNSDLLSVDISTDFVYIHSGVTSIIQNSWSTGGANYTGIDWDGTHLVTADEGNRKIRIHSGRSSTVVSSFTVTHYPRGIAIDTGPNLIVAFYEGADIGIRFHSGITSTVNSSFTVLSTRLGVAVAGYYGT